MHGGERGPLVQTTLVQIQASAQNSPVVYVSPKVTTHSFQKPTGFTRAALPVSLQNLLPLVLAPAHSPPPQQCLNYS